MARRSRSSSGTLIIVLLLVCCLCLCSSSVGFFVMGGEKEPLPLEFENPVLQDTPESRRSASSIWGGDPIGGGHGRGRLDSTQAWSALDNGIGEWYQIDLPEEAFVSGIAIRGRKDTDQWIKTFKVSRKAEDGSWKSVDSGKEYKANTDRDTQVDVNFDKATKTTAIRIYPETWNNHISLRAELYTQKVKISPPPSFFDKIKNFSF